MMPEESEKSSDDMSSGNILFGKYEVGRLLGRGQFAKVYHARNMESGQSVAIKCISKQKIVKGGLISQVKREIDIMHRMHHHHIVQLFEVLATKTKIFFVMEYVKGGELFDKVVEKGRLTEDLSRKYFHQLISAVRYCHARGVFHRDLKPENLLLDDNGDLKVTDFGLSAVTEQVRNDGLLHTLCGTPHYVAPEILGKKGYEGAKVDIWSCGIILYVLNAGYLPFNSSNLIVMYRKIYRGEFRCPKWISPNLKRFLSRLLDPNPDTRITIDGILRDPWFLTDYTNHPNLDELSYNHFSCVAKEEEEESEHGFLNAFDIISFSPGFDLSGLFGESVDDERFVLSQSPEKIEEKIEQLGEKEKATVLRKEVGQMVLQGQNGDTILEIEIHRLTHRLVVVEGRSYQDLWMKKLRMILL